MLSKKRKETEVGMEANLIPEWLQNYEKDSEWCPQHGYPLPCVKCNGMTKDEWDEFFESLTKAVKND